MSSELQKSADVRLVELSRFYGDFAAVRDVDLAIGEGEFMTLLGESGSGKTTTLMMIAGFVMPSRGRIMIGSRDVTTQAPERRNLGVVFQSYALFPHMSVGENIAYPLRMRSMGRQEIAKNVAEMLEVVELEGFKDRRIAQLSGGQQQRVALARALVFRPPVLLMDEPLGALDRRLREQLQGEIRSIQQRLGVTVVYVTHDQEEALTMSDRIAVMHQGTIQQVGKPRDVYERPASAYVGKFLGESNFFTGTVDSCRGDATLVRLESGTTIAGSGNSIQPGTKVQVMVRPESILMRAPSGEAPGDTELEGVVEGAEFLGQSIRYRLNVGGTSIFVREPRERTKTILDVGARTSVSFASSDTTIFAE